MKKLQQHFFKRFKTLQVVIPCFILLLMLQIAQIRNYQDEKNQPEETNVLDSSIRVEIKPPDIAGLQQKDLCLTVMTGVNTHWRLNPIIKTWFTHASNITYFFSDSPDPEISAQTQNHLIALDCPKGYEKRTGNCKVGHMYDFFMADERCQGAKWWCKFDDDNYVNVNNLIKVSFKKIAANIGTNNNGNHADYNWWTTPVGYYNC